MSERNVEFVWMNKFGVGSVDFPNRVSAIMETVEKGGPKLPPDFALSLVEALKQDAKKHFWPPLLFGTIVLFFNNLAEMLEIPEESITPTVKTIVKLYGEISLEGLTDEQKKKGDTMIVGGNDEGFWLKEVEDGESSNS